MKKNQPNKNVLNEVFIVVYITLTQYNIKLPTRQFFCFASTPYVVVVVNKLRSLNIPQSCNTAVLKDIRSLNKWLPQSTFTMFQSKMAALNVQGYRRRTMDSKNVLLEKNKYGNFVSVGLSGNYIVTI